MPNSMSLAQLVLQLFCSQGFSIVTMHLKRGITRSNNFEILSKVHQVIYTLDPNCTPNIMSLAHIVLQIFCSQCLPMATMHQFKKGHKNMSDGKEEKQEAQGPQFAHLPIVLMENC